VVAPDGGEAIQLGPIQMRILEDGKTTGHRLGVGEITIPPGAPHTFANPGEKPVVLLNTFTPDLYVRYFRDLGQMIADGQPLTPESTEQAMSRYATETLS
jgi:hypothetical protein